MTSLLHDRDWHHLDALGRWQPEMRLPIDAKHLDAVEVSLGKEEAWDHGLLLEDVVEVER